MRKAEPRDFYIDRFGRVWPNNPGDSWTIDAFCVTCGQPANRAYCNHRRIGKVEVRRLGGRQGCLLSKVWSFPMIVSSEHWASLEPVGMKPWQAPAPNASTVKAVRSLHSCGYCGRLGNDLVAIGGHHGDHVHVYCLVRECGTGILHVLSLEQLGKATVGEIVALDMKDTFMALYEAAMRREARGGR